MRDESTNDISASKSKQTSKVIFAETSERYFQKHRSSFLWKYRALFTETSLRYSQKHHGDILANTCRIVSTQNLLEIKSQLPTLHSDNVGNCVSIFSLSRIYFLADIPVTFNMGSVTKQHFPRNRITLRQRRIKLWKPKILPCCWWRMI
jgi:hypothetical protein